MTTSIAPAKLIQDDFSGDWEKDMPDVFRLLNKFSTDASGAIGTQVLLASLGAQKIVLKSVVVPDIWTSVTSFSNSWAIFSGSFSVKYRPLLDMGEARMIGLIKSGTIGLKAFNLPAAFWPGQDFNTATESNSAYGKILIKTSDGSVVPAVGSNVSFSLDCTWPLKTSSWVPPAPSCFPMKIASKLTTGKASTVLLGSVTDQAKNGGTLLLSGATGISWRNESGQVGGKSINNIVIDNIQGLIPNHTYQITIWAFPDQ